MKIDKREEHNQFNEQQRLEAHRQLDHAINSVLSAGKPGAIGIRLPFQRGKLGNIRVIYEVES